MNVLLVNPEKAIKLAVNDQARQLMGGKKYVNVSFTFELDLIPRLFVRAIVKLGNSSYNRKKVRLVFVSCNLKRRRLNHI